MDRTMMRRAAALLSVLGMTMVGLATLALPGAAASTVTPWGPYNATDGNLDGNTAGHPVAVIPDLPSGATDNSYGVGAKEADPCPAVVSGSIPPSKDDLTNMWIGNKQVGGIDYLYLAWSRTNTNGSATEDFELNQSGGPKCSNGVNAPRTAGDLLVTFDFQQKSSTLGVSIRTWDGTAWGSQTDLTPDQVQASVSGDTTFGELEMNLEAAHIFAVGTCESFASALLKSRASSSSFTDELKDLVADPNPIHVSNCATLEVIKDAQPDSGQAFPFTVTNAGGNPVSPAQFSLTDDGTGTANSISFTNVHPGTYTITETGVTNWNLGSIVCPGATAVRNGNAVAVTVAAGDAAVCTFVNTAAPGSLSVTKHVTGGTAPTLWTFGAHIACTNPPNTYDLTLDQGHTTVSQTGIPAGSLCTVTESTAPTTQTVTVDPSGAQTIPSGGTAFATITNAYPAKPGSLQVTKIVTGNTAPSPWSFDAHITCTNPANAYTLTLTNTDPAKSQTGIPAGSSCTVTESTPATTQTVTISPGGAQTINSDQGTNVTITNAYPTAPGSLRVTKLVTGDTKPTSWSFGARISCSGPSNTYDLTLTNVTPSKTQDGIPAGSSCTVTETGTPTTQTVTVNPSGSQTIITNQTVDATITNTYPAAPGSVKVTKVVTGGSAPTTWSFGARISCSGPSNTYDLTLTNVTPFKTQDGIPAGSTCTVTETDQPTTQTVTIDPSAAQTITSGQTTAFTITNAYPTPQPPPTPSFTPTAPDLSVVKVGPSHAKVGDFVTYTMTVTNSGTAATSNAVVVTDTLDPNTTFTTGSAGCTANGQVVTCSTSGPLGMGASTSFSVTVLIAGTATGSVTDTATVASSGVTTDTDDSSSATTTIDKVEATGGTQAPSVTPPAVIPPVVTPPAAPPKVTPPVEVLPLTGARTLPFTGTNVRLLLLAGLGLLLLGLGLVAGTWRMPRARHYR